MTNAKDKSRVYCLVVVVVGGRYSKMNSSCVQLRLKLLKNFLKMVINTMCSVSHVWLFATSWTVAHQTLLSVGFSKQEYWSGLPFPPPGDLPDPGIEPESPVLAGGFFTTSATWEAQPYRWYLRGNVTTKKIQIMFRIKNNLKSFLKRYKCLAYFSIKRNKSGSQVPYIYWKSTQMHQTLLLIFRK